MPPINDVQADLRIDRDFGLFSVTPMTAKGREWIADHVHHEEWQVMGLSIAIDGRSYATAIADGARADGLIVSDRREGR